MAVVWKLILGTVGAKLELRLFVCFVKQLNKTIIIRGAYRSSAQNGLNPSGPVVSPWPQERRTVACVQCFVPVL